jgi:hypothetical protein
MYYADVDGSTEQIANGIEAGATALEGAAAFCKAEVELLARKGELVQQTQERRHEANLAGREIMNVDRQIQAQRVTVAVCEADLALQQKQAENAAQMSEFLKTKYTNVQLYAWLDSGYRAALFQTYQLAFDLAKGAERAFQFERPAYSAGSFIEGGYWDNAHDGMLAAQRLSLGLRRLESAYRAQRGHDFEINKKFSLRQIDPMSLLRLQETGKTAFAISEYLFDYDFPGHYCRRIRNLTISIPCSDSATTVSCTLRLTSHKYRLRQKSTTDPQAAYYAEQSMDDRYTKDTIPINAAAIGNATDAGGAFEIDFDSERHAPFEGAGAISEWMLELPDIAQFDYRTISDVELALNFTSLDGGKGWRDEATKAVRKMQQGLVGKMPVTLLDLQDKSLAQWVPADQNTLTMTIKDVKKLLPYWTRRSKVGLISARIVMSGAKKLPALKMKIGGEMKALNATSDPHMKGVQVFDAPLVGKEADLEVQFPGLKMEDVDSRDEMRLLLLLTYKLLG